MSVSNRVSNRVSYAPRKRRAHALVAAISALALCAGTTSAQAQGGARSAPPRASQTNDPSLRGAISHLATKHGVWMSLGGSRGAADLFCDVCTQDPTYAWSLEASAGVRLGPELLLGVETVGWFDVFGDADRTMRTITATLRSYAFGRDRPYLTGGAGIARYRVREDNAGFQTRSPALSAGVGLDMRMGSATVSPHVTAVMSVGGKLQSERTDAAIAPTARAALLRTGVSLAWFR
jgi:hypothetical protein